jgi:site-specific recombinase XerD
LGHRDYALLLFPYNSGARASEAISVTIEDLERNGDGTGIVKLHGKVPSSAANKVPSLRQKRVSPYTIRHTTATHLLRSGVDINTIRAWLGHVGGHN